MGFNIEEMPAPKPAALSSNPENHRAERETQLSQADLWPPRVCRRTRVQKSTHI